MQQNGNECGSGYPLMMKSEEKKREGYSLKRHRTVSVTCSWKSFFYFKSLEYPSLKSGVEPAYWYQNHTVVILFYLLINCAAWTDTETEHTLLICV